VTDHPNGSNEVEQTDNVVHGDQAGRDIHKPTTIIQQAAGVTPMARMIERFRAETAADREVRQTIERLQRWMKADGHVIGLNQKLEAGGRMDIIRMAVEAKDRFAKCIMRHEFSPAAQEIYAFLLAKTHQLFVTLIYPGICRGESPAQIDQRLADVYGRVEALLEDNPLGITPEEVMGMLYWLTGNCHLQWKEQHANL
jgi:hypothetical protein